MDWTVTLIPLIACIGFIIQGACFKLSARILGRYTLDWKNAYGFLFFFLLIWAVILAVKAVVEAAAGFSPNLAEVEQSIGYLSFAFIYVIAGTWYFRDRLTDSQRRPLDWKRIAAFVGVQFVLGQAICASIFFLAIRLAIHPQ